MLGIRSSLSKLLLHRLPCFCYCYFIRIVQFFSVFVREYIMVYYSDRIFSLFYDLNLVSGVSVYRYELRVCFLLRNILGYINL